jgi:hypothetical protein
MDLIAFKERPWHTSTIHPAYASSYLHMRPAPEYANGEVILASTYRQLDSGDAGISESKVPKLGRDFMRRLDREQRPAGHQNGTNIDPQDWRDVVTGALRSPKQPNQATKRFLQLSPIVPDATIYSLSARLSSNSWNPGALVEKVVQFGSKSSAEANDLWGDLFAALTVDDNDDLWARFLSQEFQSWRVEAHRDYFVKPGKMMSEGSIESWREVKAVAPAQRCVADLKSMIALKEHLTRRQWISMLESTLRVGCASHVMWVASENIAALNLFMRVINGESPDDAIEGFSLEGAEPFLRLGQLSATPIRDLATGFVKARLGINLLLHLTQEINPALCPQTCLASRESMASFARDLPTVMRDDRMGTFRREYQKLLESDNRLVMGKKGISANIIEFLRHSLGQRQTSEPGMDSYDQGYYLAKRGSHKTAHWEVAMGPVAVLSLVHACTHARVGTTNVEDFISHMSEYGIDIGGKEVERSSLGTTLRNLGLVLDSPDAEGGMAIISPFETVLRRGQ